MQGVWAEWGDPRAVLVGYTPHGNHPHLHPPDTSLHARDRCWWLIPRKHTVGTKLW